MPRIYDSESNPIDFCLSHFPKTKAEAFRKYGNAGSGPDCRGNCFSYDELHPDYDGDYNCEVCGRKLTQKDN